MPVIDDPHALSSRLIDRGIPANQARAIADALHDTPSSWATEATVQAIRSDLTALDIKLSGQMVALDHRLSGCMDKLEERMAALPNTIMVRLGAMIVVLIGLGFTALRYLPPPHP